MRNRASGRHAASAAGTFGNLLDRWLETKEQSVEASTISSYRWVTEKYVRPGLGGARLTTLKASDIDLETMVTVDASEDVDLKLTAVSVTVDPPPKNSETTLKSAGSK